MCRGLAVYYASVHGSAMPSPTIEYHMKARKAKNGMYVAEVCSRNIFVAASFDDHVLLLFTLKYMYSIEISKRICN